MSLLEGIIGPIANLIDKIIPYPKARDAAKLELIKLQGSQDMDALRTQLSAILAEAQSADPWTSRARPSFLYVIYIMLLWTIPMGLIAAVAPDITLHSTLASASVHTPRPHAHPRLGACVRWGCDRRNSSPPLGSSFPALESQVYS
jgi:hypothetical protein